MALPEQAIILKYSHDQWENKALVGPRHSKESLWPPKHPPCLKFNDSVALVICPPPDQLPLRAPLLSAAAEAASHSLLWKTSLGSQCASTASISTTSKCKVYVLFVSCTYFMRGQSSKMLWDNSDRHYFYLSPLHRAESSFQRWPSHVPVLIGVVCSWLPFISDPWYVVTHSYATKRVWSSLCTSILSREFDTRYEETLQAEKFSRAVWFLDVHRGHF